MSQPSSPSSLPRQWSQVVRLAHALFQDRQSFRVRQPQLPPGIVASVSRDGIRVSGLSSQLQVRRDGVYLDGHIPATQGERRQARGLLSAFLGGAGRGVDAPSVVRFATQQHGALRHLTTRQLASLRSAHRGLSDIGRRQLHTHRTLLEKKWPAPILERMMIGTQAEVLANELGHEDGAVLTSAFFPLAVRRLYRLAPAFLGVDSRKRFLWASFSEQGGPGYESSEKFVCVSRCQRIVYGNRKEPAVLCVGFSRSKRHNGLLPTNTFQTILFDRGSDRPVLRQHDNPISPYYFHRLLEKIVEGGSASFAMGISVVRVVIQP